MAFASIIMFTVNPTHVFPAAVKSIARFASDDVEVFLMDGTEKGAAVVPPGVTYVRRPDLNRNALQRLGVEMATGTWCSIIEDHVVVPRNWLNAISSDPAADAIYGPVIWGKRRNPTEWANCLLSDARYAQGAKHTGRRLPVHQNAWFRKELVQGALHGEVVGAVMTKMRQGRLRFEPEMTATHVQEYPLGYTLHNYMQNSRFGATVDKTYGTWRWPFRNLFRGAAGVALTIGLSFPAYLKYKPRPPLRALPIVWTMGLMAMTGRLLAFFGRGRSAEYVN